METYRTYRDFSSNAWDNPQPHIRRQERQSHRPKHLIKMRFGDAI